jgi:hypothetical protein
LAGRPAGSLRADAADIVNLNSDAILVSNDPTLAFTSVATRTITIVFANVTYAGLARHYDNVTGIIAIELRVAEKWVSVLKDLVPGIERLGATPGRCWLFYRPGDRQHLPCTRIGPRDRNPTSSESSRAADNLCQTEAILLVQCFRADSKSRASD